MADVTKDNTDVTSRVVLIEQLQLSQTKQHTVNDAQGRPQFLFEAIVNASEGDPCLVTEYVYRTGSSTTVRSRQERVYRWKDAWDTAFTFDPSVNYDPDGDGEA